MQHVVFQFPSHIRNFFLRILQQKQQHFQWASSLFASRAPLSHLNKHRGNDLSCFKVTWQMYWVPYLTLDWYSLFRILFHSTSFCLRIRCHKYICWGDWASGIFQPPMDKIQVSLQQKKSGAWKTSSQLLCFRLSQFQFAECCAKSPLLFKCFLV